MQPFLADSTSVPTVNINQAPPSSALPFGGFQLTQCGGPDYSSYTGTAFNVSYQGVNYQIPGQWSALQRAGYHACDFQGALVQIQFLINVMLVVGVLAALVGFTWAGLNYISGQQKRIDKAHEMFPKIFWGFIIMLVGWFIVYQILVWLTGTTAYLQ